MRWVASLPDTCLTPVILFLFYKPVILTFSWGPVVFWVTALFVDTDIRKDLPLVLHLRSQEEVPKGPPAFALGRRGVEVSIL